MSGLDLRPVLPALIVAATGLVVLLLQAFTPRGKERPYAALSVAGLLAALAAVVHLARTDPGASLEGVVVADAFALFLHALLIGLVILAFLLSPPYLRRTGGERGESYALALFSTVGMLGLVSCRELVSLFLALEVMSVSLYALAGTRRDRAESLEAALKYFVTGAFSSAFFLYGVALAYGTAGSTSLDDLRVALVSSGLPSTLPLLAAGFLLVGFGFKVASVPFHSWAPDVYEGAPTTVSALMAAAVKAAAFGALLRVFLHGLPSLAADWRPAVAALAVLTMVVGNLGALRQKAFKRMLAYSSVAHAGYVLVALVADTVPAAEAVLFYLVAYGAVTVGGFGVLAALTRPDGEEPLAIRDLSGLAQRRPALAAALALFLVSLAGIPVSAGFVGKLLLFSAAVSGSYVGLAVVGVVMSVVSAYYYLGVVVTMYMRDPEGEDPWPAVPGGARLALGLSAAVALGLGVYPGPVLAWARLAAQALR